MKPSVGISIVALLFLGALAFGANRPAEQLNTETPPEEATSTEPSAQANVQDVVEQFTEKIDAPEESINFDSTSGINEEYEDLFQRYDEINNEFESLENQGGTTTNS